jgi:hypothetical protein
MSSPRPPFVAARAIFTLQDDIEARRREAAGEGSERRDRDGRPHWLDYLAISTALFAVFAAHRLLGELDTEAGRTEGAAAHLDASVALADACQAPYERALTLLAMAEWRVATGAPEAAKALLNEVKSICEPLGAEPALALAAALTDRLASD